MRQPRKTTWWWVLWGVAGLGLALAALLSRGTRTVTVPAGTRVIGALAQDLRIPQSTGTQVKLMTVEPLDAGGEVAVPEGATLEGEIVELRRPEVAQGEVELTFRFHQLMSNGRAYRLSGTVARIRSPDSLLSAGRRIRIEFTEPVVLRLPSVPQNPATRP